MSQAKGNINHVPPYKTWGKSRSLRLKDFDYESPGVIYYITIGTNRKENTFTKPSINEKVINTLKESARLYGYNLIAYCLMPDHLHILVQASDNPRDLRGFVRGFKSYCSVATPVATNIKLWQRGFYEHILRKEDNVADVSEYILNNPVRKGLVQERGQYKWRELIREIQRRDGSHDATVASQQMAWESRLVKQRTKGR